MSNDKKWRREGVYFALRPSTACRLINTKRAFHCCKRTGLNIFSFDVRNYSYFAFSEQWHELNN